HMETLGSTCVVCCRFADVQACGNHLATVSFCPQTLRRQTRCLPVADTPPPSTREPERLSSRRNASSLVNDRKRTQPNSVHPAKYRNGTGTLSPSSTARP